MEDGRDKTIRELVTQATRENSEWARVRSELEDRIFDLEQVLRGIIVPGCLCDACASARAALGDGP